MSTGLPQIERPLWGPWAILRVFFWSFLRVFFGPFSNFPSFDATERLFRSNWGRISPESDWCYLKTFVATIFVATNFCFNKCFLHQIFVATNFVVTNFCCNQCFCNKV